MNVMTNSIHADRQTISLAALDTFKAAIAAQDSTDAIAAIAKAQKELDCIIAAERTGQARLDKIASELRKQPGQSADDLAAALIAGSGLADKTSSRTQLDAEAAKLREAMGVLARQRAAAQQNLEQTRIAARRPYSVEAAKLLEEIKETARGHVAGLLACYAASDTLSRTADVRGANPTISALRDMLDRASIRGADLLMPKPSGTEAPADAQEAIGVLADLGEPFRFQAFTRISRV